MREAKNKLQHYPESKALRLSLIKALCQSGQEVEALEEWSRVVENHEELLKDRTALETLAWGVLNKGEASSQLAIRINSLIGASMTRDARAIPLIINALKGSNSMLRSVAVGLAAAYGDIPLQEEIARLLKEEKVWYVRLELIKAAGALRMTSIKERLIEIIGDATTLAEEKVAAIVSLVNMYEAIGDRELSNLIRSERAGLRELACELVVHLDLTDKVDLLFPLLHDSNPNVRMGVLNALALLNVSEIDGHRLIRDERILKLQGDHIPEVAITACWLSLLGGDKRGADKLQKWILKGEEEYARVAAGALAISGKRGAPLMKKILKKSKDPYVRTTIALGLIGQRIGVDTACFAINEHLLSKEMWMWDTTHNPLFRSLSPSKVGHTDRVPNYPLVVDQLTRLELLQVLCIMGDPKAEEAVKAFLETKTWGTVGAAAATLLQEGDDGALDVVRRLLSDPNEKVRIQAALILALHGGDKAAVEVLKTAYPNASREIKIHILEALAKVGDPKTIEFLLERLNEPFQVLRVVAATAIIQCLYH
ncbi:MAG: hypothetical protein KR126chlam1_00613 [Chlamydiae bacterium]|nr:hypothetical protein [Chlamydiota bacterium]